jgi:hypothetical protein
MKDDLEARMKVRREPSAADPATLPELDVKPAFPAVERAARLESVFTCKVSI